MDDLHFTEEDGRPKQPGGLQVQGPFHSDPYAFELGKADRTGKAAPRGPRQVGDKQWLDSRGGLRTANLSLGLEGWPKQQASAPSAGL